jgi:hypothetical protein
MAQDMVHSVRQKPQLGVWMQTRCGVHVTRSSMENGKLYKTKEAKRCVAVAPGSRLELTCRRCRKLLRMPYAVGVFTPAAPR